VVIQHDPDAKEYEIVADPESLKPKETSNGNGAGKEATAEPGTSNKNPAHESDDSDMEIVEDEEMEEEKSSAPKKRKTEDSGAKEACPAKKPRTSISDDCQIVDLC